MDEKPRVTTEELRDVAESLAPFANRLILTGAGFSKPWGGFLASELWSVITSDPSIRFQRRLDRVLHDDLNFEAVLARIEETEKADFTDGDRGVMRKAVTRAFELQEARIGGGDDQPDRFALLDQVLRTFIDEKATTCLFTLNQDRLIERHLLRNPGLGIELPGIAPSAHWGGRVNRRFDASAFRAIRGARSYIKLHGSMNWRLLREKLRPGNPVDEVIVLGGAKTEAIERFDILRMNSAIFRTAVKQQGARLLVIGYGFADPHINEIIAEGARVGLQLWIVDPKGPHAIRQQLMDVKASGLIWQGVVGHSAGYVDDLFIPGKVEHRLLKEGFLDL